MSRRILVVEDHDDCREALVMLLQTAGHEVAHAATGLDGLRRALVFRPEIAIVDIDLPDLTGYETAEALRADMERPPFLIAVSGYSEPRYRQRAVEAGFDVYVLKPWNADALEEILASAGLKSDRATG